MMKSITPVLAVLIVLTAGILFGYLASANDATAQGAQESLSVHMSHLQSMSHKLGLAIGGSNQPLAEFYLKEINEGLATIQAKYPTYQGVQVAALSKAMMDPYTKPMGDAIASGDAAAMKGAYDKLIIGCNACHTATQRAFIKVTTSSSNPFSQDFSK